MVLFGKKLGAPRSSAELGGVTDTPLPSWAPSSARGAEEREHAANPFPP